MTEQGNMVEWLLAGLLAVAKFFLGWLWHSHDQLREKQAAFETHVARSYASKDDLDKIDGKLDKILEKLDDKADKPVR